MSSEAIEHGRGETPTRWWRDLATWTGLIAIGFVLYEWTRQPALATDALCLKFGWEDFKTANWLWRSDPCRARGRACWWLFVGGGLWRVAGIALLTNLVVIFGIALTEPGKPGGGKPAGGDAFDRLMYSFCGAGVTALAGYFLAGAAAAVAAFLAWRNGIRLWLNRSVRNARQWKVWPPPDPAVQTRNWLVVLPLTAAFPLGATLVCTEYVVLDEWRVPHADFLSLGTVAILIVPFSLACAYVGEAVAAARPSACWPPDEAAGPPESPAA